MIDENGSINYMEDYVRQFGIVTKKIAIDTSLSYVYPLDSKVLRLMSRSIISSITVDYGKVIRSDLNELKYILQDCKDQRFRERALNIIESIEKLSRRISSEFKKNQSARAKQLSAYFPVLLYRTPQCLDEAIQKLLFYNALFGQMRHFHIGLGRLDMILIDYYNIEKVCSSLLYLGVDSLELLCCHNLGEKIQEATTAFKRLYCR